MDFLFLLGGDLRQMTDNVSKVTSAVWGACGQIDAGSLLLLFPERLSDSFLVQADQQIVGCIDGWAADLRESSPESSVRSFLHETIRAWPIVSDDFTGCFSGVAYNREDDSLRVFADPTGIYPLYLSEKRGVWIGGTNLVLLGRLLASSADPIGILEALSPPHFTTLGSRTLLKGFTRLLPGEMKRLRISRPPEVRFDNTIFGDGMQVPLADLASSLWETIKKDVGACVSGYRQIGLGMSGGWDSRLVAAALQDSQAPVNFYTYGTDSDEYEVSLAKACAAAVGANHHFLDTYETYFPDEHIFRENMLLTNSSYVSSWFPLLDSAEQPDQVFLLGDMFEIINGRCLDSLTSRKSRVTRTLNPFLTKGIQEKQGKVSIEVWAADRCHRLVNLIMGSMERLQCDVRSSLDQKAIEDGLDNDLQELVKRIAAHDIANALLYDELLGWYTRGRSISRQFLSLKQRFPSCAPTMGLRTIRATSKINPIDRVDGRLLSDIIKHPDFGTLGKIPSSAAPFVPSSAPRWATNTAWAIRLGIDQALIRNALRTRNKSARLRLVRTENLVALYNHPKALERVSAWFRDSPVIESTYYKDLTTARAQMRAWPLINTDIVGPASVSIFCDLVSSSSAGER